MTSSLYRFPETKLECGELDRKRINRLERLADNALAGSIKERLLCLNEERPSRFREACGNSDCAACSLETFHKVRQELQNLEAMYGNPLWLTIAHPRWRLEEGELHQANPKKLFRYFRRRIADLSSQGLKFFVAFEVSYTGQNSARFWAPHIHALVWGAERHELEKAFKIAAKEDYPRPRLISGGETVVGGRKRPKRVCLCMALKYCLLGDRYTSRPIFAAQAADTVIDDDEFRRIAGKQSLKGAPRQEAIRFFSRLSLSDITYLYPRGRDQAANIRH